MRKKLLSILGLAALFILTAAVLTSCGHRDDYAYQQPVVQQAPVVAAAPMMVAPAPVTVVAATPAHDGFLTGMLMGHLLSNGGPSYHPPVYQRDIHHNTTIVQRNTTIVRPAIAAPRANTYVYRPSRSTTFGSFKRR
jgi:hypothetical protein